MDLHILFGTLAFLARGARRLAGFAGGRGGLRACRLCYGIGQLVGDSFETHWDLLEGLNRWGFKVNPRRSRCRQGSCYDHERPPPVV
jgi:hypothetical protein